MSKYLFILFLISGVCLSPCVHGQRIAENFDKGNVDDNWKVTGSLQADTANHISAPNGAKLSGPVTLTSRKVYNQIGKITLGLKSNATPGIWKISIYTSGNTEFTNSRKVGEIVPDFNNINFSTSVIDVNEIEDRFIRLTFEPNVTTSPLYIDDIRITPITEEARKKIQTEKEQKELAKVRRADFERLIREENYNDARRLVTNYKDLYVSRIQTLAKLHKNTVAIEMVSGTASTLGDFNQLSNPTNYKKYDEIKKELFPKLDPIDTAFFNDEIENKLNTFFAKMETPLNLVIGVGDLFTGGGVTKVVGSFKGLISTAFRTEHLQALGFNRKKIEQERREGLKLYNETKTFFEDFEQQNLQALELNREINMVYRDAENLNHEVKSFFESYMEMAQVPVSEDDFISLSKNEDYNRYDSAISRHFDFLLGDESGFQTQSISLAIKELDMRFSQIDRYITEYEELSNRMTGFYADFDRLLVADCPYQNVTDEDKVYWKSKVTNLQSALSTLREKFKDNYTDIDFKNT